MSEEHITPPRFALVDGDGSNFVDQALPGTFASYGGDMKMVGRRAFIRASMPNRIAVLVGGGGGHGGIYTELPGDDMPDGMVVGNSMECPQASLILEAITALNEANGGKGVFTHYGKHDGDILQFGQAREDADDEGILTGFFEISGDTGAFSADQREKRRGCEELLFNVRVLANLANLGASMDELESLAKKANRNAWSLGALISGSYHPETGKYGGAPPTGKIRIGAGIHGEPGAGGDIDLCSPHELTDYMLDRLLADEALKDELRKGDDLVFYVNGKGGTDLGEMRACQDRGLTRLKGEGFNIHDTFTTQAATTQITAGVALVIAKVDDQLKRHWDPPCWSPGFSKRQTK